jgi:hypothetical protein
VRDRSTGSLASISGIAAWPSRRLTASRFLAVNYLLGIGDPTPMRLARMGKRWVLDPAGVRTTRAAMPATGGVGCFTPAMAYPSTRAVGQQSDPVRAGQCINRAKRSLPGRLHHSPMRTSRPRFGFFAVGRPYGTSADALCRPNHRPAHTSGGKQGSRFGSLTSGFGARGRIRTDDLPITSRSLTLCLDPPNAILAAQVRERFHLMPSRGPWHQRLGCQGGCHPVQHQPLQASVRAAPQPAEPIRCAPGGCTCGGYPMGPVSGSQGQLVVRTFDLSRPPELATPCIGGGGST